MRGCASICRRARAKSRASAAPCRFPPNARDALVTGAWDTTGLLLERYGEVDAVAARLPYIAGF